MNGSLVSRRTALLRLCTDGSMKEEVIAERARRVLHLQKMQSIIRRQFGQRDRDGLLVDLDPAFHTSAIDNQTRIVVDVPATDGHDELLGMHDRRSPNDPAVVRSVRASTTPAEYDRHHSEYPIDR